MQYKRFFLSSVFLLFILSIAYPTFVNAEDIDWATGNDMENLDELLDEPRDEFLDPKGNEITALNEVTIENIEEHGSCHPSNLQLIVEEPVDFSNKGNLSLVEKSELFDPLGPAPTIQWCITFTSVLVDEDTNQGELEVAQFIDMKQDGVLLVAQAFPLTCDVLPYLRNPSIQNQSRIVNIGHGIKWNSDDSSITFDGTGYIECMTLDLLQTAYALSNYNICDRKFFVEPDNGASCELYTDFETHIKFVPPSVENGFNSWTGTVFQYGNVEMIGHGSRINSSHLTIKPSIKIPSPVKEPSIKTLSPVKEPSIETSNIENALMKINRTIVDANDKENPTSSARILHGFELSLYGNLSDELNIFNVEFDSTLVAQEFLFSIEQFYDSFLFYVNQDSDSRQVKTYQQGDIQSNSTARHDRFLSYANQDSDSHQIRPPEQMDTQPNSQVTFRSDPQTIRFGSDGAIGGVINGFYDPACCNSGNY